jgi:acetylornithine deacetylase
MVRALQGLSTYVDELRVRAPHPLLGPPSAHIGRLEGGEGASTYAAECRATVERRTIPGEGDADVLGEIRKALGDGAEIHLVLARSPFESPSGSRIVGVLERATEAVMGRPAPLVGTGPWTDASFLGEAGVDTVVFGPRGGGAHAASEWVDIESLLTLARVLVRTPDGLADAAPG